MYTVKDFRRKDQRDPGRVFVGKDPGENWEDIRIAVVNTAIENGTDVMLADGLCNEAYQLIMHTIHEVLEKKEKQSLLLGFAKKRVDSTDVVLESYNVFGHKNGIDAYKAIWRVDIRCDTFGNVAVYFYEVSKHLNNWLLIRFAYGELETRFFSDETDAWKALCGDFLKSAEELLKEVSFDETLEMAKSILVKNRKYSGDLFSFTRTEGAQSRLVMFDPVGEVFWEIRHVF